MRTSTPSRGGAGGAGVGAHQRGRGGGHLRAGLRHAVGERQRQPGGQRAFQQGRRGARPPQQHAPQGGREGTGEAGVEQPVEHGGHQRDMADGARPDQVDQYLQPPLAAHQHPAAGCQRPVDQRHPANVGERERSVPGVVGPQCQAGAHGARAGGEVSAGERDRACSPPGARCAQDGNHVVGPRPGERPVRGGHPADVRRRGRPATARPAVRREASVRQREDPWLRIPPRRGDHAARQLQMSRSAQHDRRARDRESVTHLAARQRRVERGQRRPPSGAPRTWPSPPRSRSARACRPHPPA